MNVTFLCFDCSFLTERIAEFWGGNTAKGLSIQIIYASHLHVGLTWGTGFYGDWSQANRYIKIHANLQMCLLCDKCSLSYLCFLFHLNCWFCTRTAWNNSSVWWPAHPVISMNLAIYYQSFFLCVSLQNGFFICCHEEFNTNIILK